MWAFLTTGIARWIAAALIGTVGLGGIGLGLYLKGRSDGNLACTAKQQAQMAKMEAYVRSVRERIEQNLPLDDSILNSDPFERTDEK